MSESMPKKRMTAGDVFELAIGDRAGHIQYLGEHPRYGSTIRVARGVRSVRPSNLAALFQHPYIAFYPLKATLGKGLVKAVGTMDVESAEVPRRWRRAGARRDGRIETWIVDGPDGQAVCRTLEPDQLALPIGAIWNHEMLVERLRTGWTPEMEK